MNVKLDNSVNNLREKLFAHLGQERYINNLQIFPLIWSVSVN